MKKLRMDWDKIRGAAIITTVCTGVTGLFGAVGGLVFLAVDSDNGRTYIAEAVEKAQTLNPEPGRNVRLVDFDTVQVTQGVMTQTFSFALKRVITSAHYGNGQQFNESVDFSAYRDQPAIQRARGEGCTLARNLKSGMEGYDFGIRATRTETRVRQENIDLADLYIRKNCAPAP